MKLSQRLVRAGIVCLMVGSVAVILPNTGESAVATAQCVAGHQYEFTKNGTSNYTASSADTGSSIAAGGTLPLDVFTDGATGTAISFTSDHPSIASVSPNAGSSTTVTGVAAGMATITADFGGSVKLTYTITVQ